MKKKIIPTIIIILLVIIIGVLAYIFFAQNDENNDNNNQIDENILKETVTNEIYSVYANNTLNIEELTNEQKPIILFFIADWCNPCQEYKPIVEEVANEFLDKVNIRFLDVDQNEELKEYYDINNVPSAIFINSNGTPYIPEEDQEYLFETKEDDGNIIYTKIIGSLSKDQLVNVINRMCNN